MTAASTSPAAAAAVSSPSPDQKLDVDRKGMNLWQKLAYIKTQVRNIPKNGWNKHFEYKFVQASDVYDVVGHLMGLLGVVMLPKGVEMLGEREARSGSILMLRFNWEFVNADAPTEREAFQSMGEGQDSGDKRSYKATTGAEKYALISAFQVPTGLDPERDDGSQQSQDRGSDSGRKASKRTTGQDTGQSGQSSQGQRSGQPRQDQKTQEKPASNQPQPLMARFGPYKKKPVDGLSDDQIRETIQVGKTNAVDPKYADHKTEIEAHIAQLERVLAARQKPGPDSQKGQAPAAV